MDLTEFSVVWEATRAKDQFQKELDSILAKQAKLRGLIKDLEKNYEASDIQGKPLVSVGRAPMQCSTT